MVAAPSDGVECWALMGGHGGIRDGPWRLSPTPWTVTEEEQGISSISLHQWPTPRRFAAAAERLPRSGLSLSDCGQICCMDIFSACASAGQHIRGACVRTHLLHHPPKIQRIVVDLCVFGKEREALGLRTPPNPVLTSFARVSAASGLSQLIGCIVLGYACLRCPHAQQCSNTCSAVQKSHKRHHATT